MSGKADSPRARIDDSAKALFLAALRRGARREDAAAEAGFSLMGFYGARRRDPVFGAGWAEALALAPAAERRADAYARRGEVRIVAANRRVLQRRRRAYVRFTAERQAAFLGALAESADTKASAAEAGVCESTVHRHARIDPGFRAVYRETLADCYVRLQAEAIRQRLAALERLRAAVDDALDGPSQHLQGRGAAEGGGGASSGHAACPHCGRSAEADIEFDRIMKLLARWDRKPRKVETRFKPGGRRQAWTFDQAIDAIDAKLRAWGVRRRAVEGEEADADGFVPLSSTASRHLTSRPCASEAAPDPDAVG